MKFFEERKTHKINVGNQNAKIDPLSVQLYSEEIEERFGRDEGYRLSKMKAISTEYNKAKTTNLRLVADWLWDFVKKNGTHTETSFDEISQALNCSEPMARISVSKLNFWDGFPFTWIPVPRKSGFIQLSLNNEDNYEDWRLKKEKIIISNEQAKNKAETITPSRKIREKHEQKILEKN
ncbi:MAG TPA: hypothetical protein VMX17_03575 [Candidatus Glassbacteria bacterium]|nr:hypothetical protein [Candidatus Glassbacteria bacterium]